MAFITCFKESFDSKLLNGDDISDDARPEAFKTLYLKWNKES